jgi:hypothetical protein
MLAKTDVHSHPFPGDFFLLQSIVLLAIALLMPGTIRKKKCFLERLRLRILFAYLEYGGQIANRHHLREDHFLIDRSAEQSLQRQSDLWHLRPEQLASIDTLLIRRALIRVEPQVDLARLLSF